MNLCPGFLMKTMKRGFLTAEDPEKSEFWGHTCSRGLSVYSTAMLYFYGSSHILTYHLDPHHAVWVIGYTFIEGPSVPKYP